MVFRLDITMSFGTAAMDDVTTVQLLITTSLRPVSIEQFTTADVSSEFSTAETKKQK